MASELFCIAAFGGHANVIVQLLALKPNLIDVRTDKGDTASHAAWGGHANAVML